MKMSTHGCALTKASVVAPYLKYCIGTTRAGVTQIQLGFEAKLTVVFDCLRYRTEVRWNPHKIPMQKKLHDRRLTLKREHERIAEPGRI